MHKKLTVVILTVLLMFSFTASASEGMASETIKVVARIPAFQELKVIKPVYIENVNNEFKEKSLDESVVIKKAGQIRVKSNTHWRLELISTNRPENFEMKIKVSGSSEWKDVSSGKTTISGQNGDHLLNFDLKLIPDKEENLDLENTTINFNYTLVQI